MSVKSFCVVAYGVLTVLFSDLVYAADRPECVICLDQIGVNDLCMCPGVKSNRRDRACCMVIKTCSNNQPTPELILGGGGLAAGVSGHYFHQWCLQDWVGLHDDCPMCRKVFSPLERIGLWQNRVFMTASLWQAAATGDVPAVQQILHNSNASIVNVCDIVGFGPLHYAALYGHETVVSELLSVAGIVIDQPDYFGLTPLYWAAYGGHAGVVGALLVAGARVRWNIVDAAYSNGHNMLALTLLIRLR